MEAIGGYLALELSNNGGHIYHEKALSLNSGRNAFKHILKERGVSHISVPYYTCQAVLEPINALDLDFEFYQLDKNLEIAALDEMKKDSHILYINYFGLKGAYIEELTTVRDKLIIDNSQAFYDNPQPGIDTFYSPRKFFGVPGGGYVYGPEEGVFYEKDTSYGRSHHLLIRWDIDAEAGYEKYQENEEKFVDRPIKSMSALTQCFLSNIDYEAVRKQRIANYSFLHKRLASSNTLQKLADTSHICPLIYPFKNENINRKQLIEQRIYVPKYWPDIVVDLPSEDCIEYELVSNLIALPIDQRYSNTEMQHIIDVINKYV